MSVICSADIHTLYRNRESVCACRSTRVLCILIVFLFFMIIIHIVFKSTGFGVKLFESQFHNLLTIWLWVIQLLCALVFIYKRNTITRNVSWFVVANKMNMKNTYKSALHHIYSVNHSHKQILRFWHLSII